MSYHLVCEELKQARSESFFLSVEFFILSWCLFFWHFSVSHNGTEQFRCFWFFVLVSLEICKKHLEKLSSVHQFTLHWMVSLSYRTILVCEDVLKGFSGYGTRWAFAPESKDVLHRWVISRNCCYNCLLPLWPSSHHPCSSRGAKGNFFLSSQLVYWMPHLSYLFFWT
jgi:hypothetical protein